MERADNRFQKARREYNQHGEQAVATVAKETKVSKSLIDDLEAVSGKPRGVSYQTVAKLAKHYGVSADYLLGLSDVPSPDPKDQEICNYLHLSVDTVHSLAADGVLEFNGMLDRFLNTRLYREFMYCLYRLESLSVEAKVAVAKAGDPEKIDQSIEENKKLEEMRLKINAERYAIWEIAEGVAASLTGCREAEGAIENWCSLYNEQHTEWMKKEFNDGEH